jgi:hypothetical protein
MYKIKCAGGSRRERQQQVRIDLTNANMGIFDGLQESSEDEDTSLADEQQQVTEVTDIVGSSDVVDLDGWHMVGRSSIAQEQGSDDDEDSTCLICKRGFSNKHKSISIPCIARCNQLIGGVHKRCLTKWREKGNSCPLCRSPLTPLLTNVEATLGDHSDDEDKPNSFVFVEMDVRARRGVDDRRIGKTNTFKIAQQRQYAIAKRNAQRAASKKGVTFNDQIEEEY